METILDALRDVLGPADFYIEQGSYNSWDYGAMIEYFVGAIIFIIVFSSIFKLVRKLFFG